jgi:hypothetical protein
MDLVFDDIVSVAGKGGLFKILKPTKTGYIVEELNDSKKKMVLGPNHRVSLLKEISIYTTDTEGAVPLNLVFEKIREKHGQKLPCAPKDDSGTLFSFLGDILPEFDAEKVYHSDVKKLVSWYNLLSEIKSDIVFVEKVEEVKENPKKKTPAKPKAEKTEVKSDAKTKQPAKPKKTTAKSKDSAKKS